MSNNNISFTSKWPSHEGFKAAHLNINYFINKFEEASNIILRSRVHSFALTETHLDSRIDSLELSIPNYSLIRKDSTLKKNTGLCVYSQLL